MIEVPTVLIFGAGVSKDYDYPLGNDLVAELLSLEKNGFFIKLVEILGLSVTSIQPFCEKLEKSQSYTIDDFLEINSEYIEIGKLAISYIIKMHEVPYIFDKQKNRDMGCYRYLFNRIIKGTGGKINSNLSIITFNYDRSFEYYIYNVYRNISRESDSYNINQLNNIRIVHINGYLGALPWQGNNSSESYMNLDIQRLGNDPTMMSRPAKLLYESSKKIKIISDENGSIDDLKLVKDILSNAKRVYILGFGYHENNLSRLGIKDLSITDENTRNDNDPYPKYEHFRGSGLGFEDRDTDLRRIMKNWRIFIPDVKLNALGFLNKYAIL